MTCCNIVLCNSKKVSARMYQIILVPKPKKKKGTKLSVVGMGISLNYHCKELYENFHFIPSPQKNIIKTF